MSCRERSRLLRDWQAGHVAIVGRACYPSPRIPHNDGILLAPSLSGSQSHLIRHLPMRPMMSCRFSTSKLCPSRRSQFTVVGEPVADTLPDSWNEDVARHMERSRATPLDVRPLIAFRFFEIKIGEFLEVADQSKPAIARIA